MGVENAGGEPKFIKGRSKALGVRRAGVSVTGSGRCNPGLKDGLAWKDTELMATGEDTFLDSQPASPQHPQLGGLKPLLPTLL